MVRFLFLSFCIGIGWCNGQSSRFEQNAIRSSVYEEEDIQYLVHLPKGSKVPKKGALPLLVFLHGSNQTGGNIDKITTLGPLSLVKEEENLPFIIAAPHLPYKLASRWPVQLIDDVLEDVKKKYNVDETRIYVTGVSKGAAGVWDYCSTYPEKVTAALPIAGYGNQNKVCGMKTVPVWAFHGGKDTYVNPNSSRTLVNKLKKCGGDVLYTEYHDGKHNIWVETYLNPVVYDWMLNFQKGKAPLRPSYEFVKSDIDLEQSSSYKLPRALKEISGLIRNQKGELWAHNDSGNNPAIFQVDTTGQVLHFLKVLGAANNDWEDIAQDTEGNLYIGDIGNNTNDRKSFQIYKVAAGYTNKTKVYAERIEFTIPEQKEFPPAKSELNYDFEAMIWYKDALYIFSKNRTIPYNSVCNVYKIPAKPGQHQATLVGSTTLGNGNRIESWITGADYYPDTNQLALLSSNKMYIFSNFSGDSFFEGEMQKVEFNHMSQKEAICFHSADQFWIADETFMEISGGFLYFIKINE